MSAENRLARLEELAKLEDGWLDGSGRGMDPRSVRMAKVFLSVVGGDPAIFPTPEGNIQFEWSTDDSYVEVEFNPDSYDSGIFCSEVEED